MSHGNPHFVYKTIHARTALRTQWIQLSVFDCSVASGVRIPPLHTTTPYTCTPLVRHGPDFRVVSLNSLSCWLNRPRSRGRWRGPQSGLNLARRLNPASICPSVLNPSSIRPQSAPASSICHGLRGRTKGRRGRLKTCRETPGQIETGLRTDGGKLGQIEAEENKKWRTMRLPCLDTERP